MKHTLLTRLVFTVSALLTNPILAAEIKHDTMNHQQHMAEMDAAPVAPGSAEAMPMAMTAVALREPGNDAFGTIQEVIQTLDADPETDWNKVDLEALRQHLIDMNNFTYEVDVLSQADIEKGTRVVVMGTSEAARASLSRALDAHPAMLKSETGWSMSAKTDGDRYILDIETDRPEEIARLRALGYIGVMALGNHHQVHHWLMARGSKPHGQ